jgi:hypothetical protein
LIDNFKSFNLIATRDVENFGILEDGFRPLRYRFEALECLRETIWATKGL